MPLRMGVKLSGNQRYHKRMATAPDRVKREARRTMHLAGEILAGQAKREVRGSRTRAKRLGLPVTAPPNRLGIDTGIGRQAIGVQERIHLPSARSFLAGSGTIFSEIVVAAFGVEYMSFHELKRKYVWLRPAIRKTRSRIRALTGRIFRVV